MNWNYVNPFEVAGKWYKGNVHTHSTLSDGTKTPNALVEIYSEAGYNFLSITDHGIVADVEELNGGGLLLIPGEEICIGKSNADTFYHIVGLGVKETLPFKDFDIYQDPQEIIEAINIEGAVSIIAHPYWSGLDHQDLMKLINYHGVEIYNTSCDYERNTGLSSSHIDGLIAAGRKPLIFAVDDHHGAERPQLPLDACGAWINVKASSLTESDVLSSIKRGLFYSSTGPEIKELKIVNGEIRISCSPARHISFISTPSLGMKFHAIDEPLTNASYRGRPGETYVRVEVTDHEGRMAWTNPLYTLQNLI